MRSHLGDFSCNQEPSGSRTVTTLKTARTSLLSNNGGTNLNDKKIAWRQRIIPQTGDVSQLNWELQRFDEVFKLQAPQIRGITLYWRKADNEREGSTTPRKLELDTYSQQLYIYPQSQQELVIRVGVPEIIYQKIEIKNPQYQSTRNGENHIIILRDQQQQLQITLNLTPDNLAQLKEQLPG
jgi:hypothetical protein